MGFFEKDIYKTVWEDTIFYYSILTFNQRMWRLFEIVLLTIFLLINLIIAYIKFEYEWIIYALSFYFLFVYVLYLISYLDKKSKVKKFYNLEHPKDNIILSQTNSDFGNRIANFLLSINKNKQFDFKPRRKEVEIFLVEQEFLIGLYALTFLMMLTNIIILGLDFDKNQFHFYFMFFFAWLLILFPFYTFVYSLFLYVIYPKIKIKKREEKDEKISLYKNSKIERGYIYYPYFIEFQITNYYLNTILYKLRKLFILYLTVRFRKHNIHLLLLFIVLLILTLIFLLFCNTGIKFLKDNFQIINKFMLFSIFGTLSIVWFSMVIKFLISLFPSEYMYRIKNIGNKDTILNFTIFYNHQGRIYPINPMYIWNKSEDFLNLESDSFKFIFTILIVVMLTIIFTVLIGIIGWIDENNG